MKRHIPLSRRPKEVFWRAMEEIEAIRAKIILNIFFLIDYGLRFRG
jgi:hypothetical protein